MGSENEVEKKAHLEEDSKGLGGLVGNFLQYLIFVKILVGKKTCENMYWV